LVAQLFNIVDGGFVGVRVDAVSVGDLARLFCALAKFLLGGVSGPTLLLGERTLPRDF